MHAPIHTQVDNTISELLHSESVRRALQFEQPRGTLAMARPELELECPKWYVVVGTCLVVVAFPALLAVRMRTRTRASPL